MIPRFTPFHLGGRRSPPAWSRGSPADDVACSGYNQW